jgi:membrane protease YdiL (CAAX protease family)
MNPRSLASRIFFSESEHRLRAGWRILAQAILNTLVGLVLVLPAQLVLLLTSPDPGIALLISSIASLAAITISVLLARRYLDRRSFTSLGFQGGMRVWRDLLSGFWIAGLMMLIIYLIERLAGWLSLTGAAWQDIPPVEIILSLGIMLVAFIAVGWQEELYFRGYLLQNTSEGLNPAWGIALASLVFGLAHLTNPNASLMGALGVTLAGLFMAYAYWRTRQLWLPIGIHIGWNFFEGPLLGFPVSGFGTFQLLRNQIAGPILFTGGAFGPEAGLVLIPGLVVGIMLVYIYTRI